ELVEIVEAHQRSPPPVVERGALAVEFDEAPFGIAQCRSAGRQRRAGAAALQTQEALDRYRVLLVEAADDFDIEAGFPRGRGVDPCLFEFRLGAARRDAICATDQAGREQAPVLGVPIHAREPELAV